MSNNKQETAVEWLASELSNHLEMPHKYFIEILDQAKEMEKEQILQSLNDGKAMVIGTIENKSLEHYYNETYGSDETIQ